jgi:acyl carrier protein
MNEDIRGVLRDYIAASSLVRSPGPLTDATSLAMHGVLDSIAVLELVLFLETRFGIEFSMRDLDRRRLSSIDHIEALVTEKLAQKTATRPLNKQDP